MEKVVDKSSDKLRVAFLAGTLGQGGAEKQLYFMVRALLESGVKVNVLSLTKGEFFEQKLSEIGCPPIFVGQLTDPLSRLFIILRELRQFKPHFFQSAHFFGNLYVVLVGNLTNAVSIGAIRGDLNKQIQENGFWGKLLLKSPEFLLANSISSQCQGIAIFKRKISYIPNVIDLQPFNVLVSKGKTEQHNTRLFVVTIARLVESKKIEDFLTSLHFVRKNNNSVRGVIIGDGPDKELLEKQAALLGLLPDGVEFLGMRDDIPLLLSQVDLFVLTSAHEGFPNVILEAMAASLPVITTPAGDANIIVEDGITGFIIPHGAPEELARRILELAEMQELRKTMGMRGRERVEKHYSYEQLAGNLLQIYQEFAHAQGNQHLLKLLNG